MVDLNFAAPASIVLFHSRVDAKMTLNFLTEPFDQHDSEIYFRVEWDMEFIRHDFAIAVPVIFWGKLRVIVRS